MTGAELIAAERERQIKAEGWSPEHDDQHDDFQMTNAAIAYCVNGITQRHWTSPPTWPWDESWWKPGSRISDLTKAGALIAAEIDRLQRQRNATK